MIQRRKTRQIMAGGVRIGGDAPVSVQSMAKTDTRDVAATVKQIKNLEAAGCDIVRVAVPDSRAARAIKDIKKKINCPLVADIHFQYKLAIEAINAGADKIRLNPGNIKDKEDIAQVVKLAKKKKIPIRIGLNSGSIPSPLPSPQDRRDILVPQEAGLENPAYPKRRVGTQLLPLPVGERAGVRGMVEAACDYIKIFEQLDFYDIIISLKASDVVMTIDAYREMAGRCDYPFHLGVTAAGPSGRGIVKSSVGIGALLSEGIGDTIRVSLTGDPREEARAANEILSALNLRKGGIDIVSCPTCGRCEVDLVKVVREFENRCRGRFQTCPTKRQFKVAIMGCVVNGPGEAKEADIGIAAGKKCGILFKKGKIVRKIKESDFVKALLDEMDSIVNTNS